MGIRRKVRRAFFRLLPEGWRLKLMIRYNPHGREMIVGYWGKHFADAIDWRGRVDWFKALQNEPDEEKQERIMDSVVRVINVQREEDR